MTPEPQKSNLERAEKSDLDAQVEYKKGNYVFAGALALHAHHLRMQDNRDKKEKPG